MSEQLLTNTISAERETELRDDIDAAERDLRGAQHKYLESCGWKYTCATPGSLWLWEKKLKDGRTVICNVLTAISIQEWI